MPNIDIDRLKQCAMEAAAFAVRAGCREINGKAVMAMASYINTINGIADERPAVIGRAFDIFAAAVVSEGE